MDVTKRHPVASSTVACVVLAALLMTLAFALPLGAHANHAAGHFSLAVPVLLLLAAAVLWWPPAGAEAAGRLARGTLLAGLAIAGVGLVTEGVGAFGYATDQPPEANGLTVLHDVGVAVWPIGFSAVMAGVIMSVGVGLARRRGAASTGIVTGFAVVAVVAVVAFIVGGVIFGY
jgi:hypothetical protein